MVCRAGQRGSEPEISGVAQPADAAGFTGRDDQLKQLDALLPTDGASASRAVVISAVSGTAGKTALAVHWAHRTADRVRRRQLYVNLRGFDPGGSPLGSAEAVHRFFDALDVPAQCIPDDPDAPSRPVPHPARGQERF